MHHSDYEFSYPLSEYYSLKIVDNLRQNDIIL
jgi:hypothetical protein